MIYREPSRRDFLKTACLAVGAGLLPSGCLSVHSSAGRRPPNIVFILADDLGYMDVAAYAEHQTGTPRSAMFYETPHIDALVDNGVSFSQAYGNQLCSPTRAALLTGRYHCRIGISNAWFDNIPNYYNQGLEPPNGYHPLDADHSDRITAQQAWNNAKVLQGLPAGSQLDQGWNEISMPEVLTDHTSAFVGKWHLGAAGVKGHSPGDQGFEVLAHLCTGGCRYYDYVQLWQPGTWRDWESHKAVWDQPRVQGSWNYLRESADKYLTDALTDLAVDYIRRQTKTPERPFFLNLWHFAPHSPLQARPEDIDYFSKKSTRGWHGHENPTFAGMIKALDDSVGRIMETLKETDQSNNTIVVFYSDNGSFMHYTSNAPLRNGKAFLHEGGIRVPLIIYAPNIINKPAWSDVPVHAIDIMPTLAELCGKEVKHDIDGKSFASLLNDPSNKQEKWKDKPMFWHYPFNVALNDPNTGMFLTPSSAIRKGDYKLIWDWHGRLELYNLADDIGENHDLSERQPDCALALFKELVDWLNMNVERRYFPTPNPEYDAAKDNRPYPFRDLVKEFLGRTAPLGQPDAMGKNSGRG